MKEVYKVYAGVFGLLLSCWIVSGDKPQVQPSKETQVVTPPTDEYHKYTQFADKVSQKLGLPRTPEIRFVDLGDKVAGKAYPGTLHIEINPDRPPELKRFVIAHELAHINDFMNNPGLCKPEKLAQCEYSADKQAVDILVALGDTEAVRAKSQSLASGVYASGTKYAKTKVKNTH
jgi:hypothetical protein